MLKLTVTVEVEADVDGWAKASNVNAATALMEIRGYLRDIAGDAIKGQTYLSVAKPADVTIDLGLDGLTLD